MLKHRSFSKRTPWRLKVRDTKKKYGTFDFEWRVELRGCKTESICAIWAVLKGIKTERNTGWNLQERVLGLDRHAGFSKGDEDGGNNGEEDWAVRGCDEVRGVEWQSPGLIQNALPWLPLLLVSACWSDRKTSSLLSLCERSLVSSLSTQRITHSRLLSTLSQIFS